MAQHGDGRDEEVANVIGRLLPVVETATADELDEMLSMLIDQARPGGNLLEAMRSAADRFEPPPSPPV